MRKLFSATFGVCLLLAGLALIYKQLTGIDPFILQIFAWELLAMAGAA